MGDSGQISVKLVMESKTGAFAVYGMTDFESVLKAGCEAAGYDMTSSCYTEPYKLQDGGDYWKNHMLVSIKPRREDGGN